MGKILILFVILLFGIIVTAIPETSFVDFFPFADQQISLQTHADYIFEGLAKVGFAYLIYAEATKYRFPLFVFLTIQILDVVDYCLTYNGVWFHLGKFPVSMNTVGLTVFALSIIYEVRK